MAETEYEGEVIEITLDSMLEEAKRNGNEEAVALLMQWIQEARPLLH